MQKAEMWKDRYRSSLQRWFADAALALWEGTTRWASLGPASRRARQFGSFGEGSLLAFPPQVTFNEYAIHIGRDTALGPWCSLTVGMTPGQAMLSDRVLVIGDRCVIGRGCSIAANLAIEIGDDVYFGPNVFVTDHNHSNLDSTIPIGLQSAPEKPVVIGERSWLGTGVVVCPGVTIGKNAIVGANSVVTRDLPDGSVSAGAPASVIK